MDSSRVRRQVLSVPTRLAVAILLGLLGLLAADSAEAQVYNLHLVTDSVPDYTDLPSFVHSVTDAWSTPEEKCIAIWRWGRRSRRQTSCAVENGRTILDPILHYNSYGAMNCGVISSLNVACWLQLGYQARYIQLGDHTVSEVSWDDGRHWHLFDSSMSVFCRDHDGQVASCEQIQQSHACALSGGKAEPGHLYLYHFAPQCGTHPGPTGWRGAADDPVGYGRTLAAGASSYTDGFSVSRYTQDARYGHRHVLNLRPHEVYTRYWEPLDEPDGKPNPEAADPDYFRPMANGSDPDDQHGLNNLRANGRWEFEPDLRDPDCANSFYDSSGIVADGTAGLHPQEAGGTAFVVFKISAANTITSMTIDAAGRGSSADGSLRVLVSRDTGLHWQQVWSAERSGEVAANICLREAVAGVTECLVRFEMRAAADPKDTSLKRLKITTITQLNRLTLPRLTLGANRILLRADQQTETTVLWPALHAGRHRETAVQEEDVHSDDLPDGGYKATLGAGVKGKPCTVTWRVDVPTEITQATYGIVSTNRSGRSYVSLQRSWDGERFVEFHRNADGDAPFDEQVLHTVSGDEVPSGTHQAWFRGEFFCTGGEASYNMPGIQDLLLRVEHRPRRARFQPIDVTWHWTEHHDTGDVPRWHTERVSSLPHEYAVNTAGRRPPTMNSVRIHLQGYGPDGPAAGQGYSDGQQPSSNAAPPRFSYVWGNNWALGKPYTASRSSTDRTGNPDSSDCELTNGTVIAPTATTASRSVQSATAFWPPGEPLTLDVDLQSEQPLAGVRVSSHQPNADYCHPERIEVSVSDDGHSWRQTGIIRHDELWRPPGDYEAWEHDDDPDYRDLPAGGRLAYSFPLVFDEPLRAAYVRFVCVPLAGRGLGLSELQVFDRVITSPWPDEIRHRARP